MKGLKEHLKEQLGETQRGIREAAVKAREAARRTEDARRAAKEIPDVEPGQRFDHGDELTSAKRRWFFLMIMAK
jgi:hypothetical protein